MVDKNDAGNDDRESNGDFKRGNKAGKQFQKGNPGGPGRPPNDQSLTHMTRAELFRERMVLSDPDDPESELIPTSYAKEFIESQIKKGILGDPTASAHLWNRIEGKVMETIEHSGGVTIRMEYDAVLDDPHD